MNKKVDLTRQIPSLPKPNERVSYLPHSELPILLKHSVAHSGSIYNQYS